MILLAALFLCILYVSTIYSSSCTRVVCEMLLAGNHDFLFEEGFYREHLLILIESWHSIALLLSLYLSLAYIFGQGRGYLLIKDNFAL